MMRLRKQTFFTLAALNQAIRFLLDDLNRRAFILSKSLDKVPLQETETDTQTSLPLEHDNVRGADYYH